MRAAQGPDTRRAGPTMPASSTNVSTQPMIPTFRPPSRTSSPAGAVPLATPVISRPATPDSVRLLPPPPLTSHPPFDAATSHGGSRPTAPNARPVGGAAARFVLSDLLVASSAENSDTDSVGADGPARVPAAKGPHPAGKVPVAQPATHWSTRVSAQGSLIERGAGANTVQVAARAGVPDATPENRRPSPLLPPPSSRQHPQPQQQVLPAGVPRAPLSRPSSSGTKRDTTTPTATSEHIPVAVAPASRVPVAGDRHALRNSDGLEVVLSSIAAGQIDKQRVEAPRRDVVHQGPGASYSSSAADNSSDDERGSEGADIAAVRTPLQKAVRVEDLLVGHVASFTDPRFGSYRAAETAYDAPPAASVAQPGGGDGDPAPLPRPALSPRRTRRMTQPATGTDQQLPSVVECGQEQPPVVLSAAQNVAPTVVVVAGVPSVISVRPAESAPTQTANAELPRPWTNNAHGNNHAAAEVITAVSSTKARGVVSVGENGSESPVPLALGLRSPPPLVASDSCVRADLVAEAKRRFFSLPLTFSGICRIRVLPGVATLGGGDGTGRHPIPALLPWMLPPEILDLGQNSPLAMGSGESAGGRAFAAAAAAAASATSSFTAWIEVRGHWLLIYAAAVSGDRNGPGSPPGSALFLGSPGSMAVRLASEKYSLRVDIAEGGSDLLPGARPAARFFSSSSPGGNMYPARGVPIALHFALDDSETHLRFFETLLSASRRSVSEVNAARDALHAMRFVRCDVSDCPSARDRGKSDNASAGAPSQTKTPDGQSLGVRFAAGASVVAPERDGGGKKHSTRVNGPGVVTTDAFGCLRYALAPTNNTLYAVRVVDAGRYVVHCDVPVLQYVTRHPFVQRVHFVFGACDGTTGRPLLCLALSPFHDGTLGGKGAAAAAEGPDRAMPTLRLLSTVAAVGLVVGPASSVAIIAAELCLAVAFLHGNGVGCGCLSPRRVFLDSQGHAVLFGVGVSSYAWSIAQSSLGILEFLSPRYVAWCGRRSGVGAAAKKAASWQPSSRAPGACAASSQLEDAFPQDPAFAPCDDWWSLAALLFLLWTGKPLVLAARVRVLSSRTASAALTARRELRSHGAESAEELFDVLAELALLSSDDAELVFFASLDDREAAGELPRGAAALLRLLCMPMFLAAAGGTTAPGAQGPDLVALLACHYFGGGDAPLSAAQWAALQKRRSPIAPLVATPVKGLHFGAAPAAAAAPVSSSSTASNNAARSVWLEPIKQTINSVLSTTPGLVSRGRPAAPSSMAQRASSGSRGAKRAAAVAAVAPASHAKPSMPAASIASLIQRLAPPTPKPGSQLLQQKPSSTSTASGLPAKPRGASCNKAQLHRVMEYVVRHADDLGSLSSLLQGEQARRQDIHATAAGSVPRDRAGRSASSRSPPSRGSSHQATAAVAAAAVRRGPPLRLGPSSQPAKPDVADGARLQPPPPLPLPPSNGNRHHDRTPSRRVRSADARLATARRSNADVAVLATPPPPPQTRRFAPTPSATPRDRHAATPNALEANVASGAGEPQALRRTRTAEPRVVPRPRPRSAEIGSRVVNAAYANVKPRYANVAAWAAKQKAAAATAYTGPEQLPPLFGEPPPLPPPTKLTAHLKAAATPRTDSHFVASVAPGRAADAHAALVPTPRRTHLPTPATGGRPESRTGRDAEGNNSDQGVGSGLHRAASGAALAPLGVPTAALPTLLVTNEASTAAGLPVRLDSHNGRIVIAGGKRGRGELFEDGLADGKHAGGTAADVGERVRLLLRTTTETLLGPVLMSPRESFRTSAAAAASRPTGGEIDVAPTAAAANKPAESKDVASAELPEPRRGVLVSAASASLVSPVPLPMPIVAIRGSDLGAPSPFLPANRSALVASAAAAAPNASHGDEIEDYPIEELDEVADDQGEDDGFWEPGSPEPMRESPQRPK